MLWILLASLAVLAGRMLWQLVLRTIYELQGPITADSNIYWAVGRGILNGLTPYKDLYETKPPGIFLLSALLLWLRGNMHWGGGVQAAIIFFFAFPLHLTTWKRTQKEPYPWRILAMLASILLGTELSLYVAERSGEFQVESFGAFFGMLYVAQLALSRSSSWRKLFLSAAFLVLSVGFKEPFLLVCAAAALILCPSFRGFAKGFLMPLILGAVVSSVILALMGMLIPYVTIYLPEMIHLHTLGDESFWERGTYFLRTFIDLKAGFPYLSITVFGILFLTFILKARITRPRWKIAIDLLRTILAVYLTLLAVGLGGQFYNHHYVFAVPFYAAAFVALLDQTTGLSQGSMRRGILLILTLWMAHISYLVPIQNFHDRFPDAQFTQLNEKMGQQIDQVLDACNIKQYLFLGGNGVQPYGYTKHSPLGPIFFQLGDFVRADRPHAQEAFRKQLHTAMIVVRNLYMPNDMTEETRHYIELHFTEHSWPCAEGTHLVRPEYTLLFRDTQE